ncbi:MAG: serine/threonine-protein kinase, partial [Verrucomicrobiota bacterium]
MDTKTEDLGAAPTNYKLPAFADAADPVGVENAPSLDDYELIGTIGRGGMGVVYEARQISLNRLVAIKMLSANLPLEGEFILRFQMEAEAAASIDHPNIVPIYEVGEEDGQPFIVMKLIEGQSLAESSQLLLGDRRAAELMVTISRAVDAAHRAGILHRDLKPGNILIEKESGEPHVADFGLAKRIGVGEEFGLTLSGQVLGTPGFMAPEQASGSSLTTAADIYSLGAILYQLLT